MTLKFCHNCGKQTPSPDSKFCPSCGTSLASLNSKPAVSAPVVPTFTPSMTGGDDDDDVIDRLEHIRVNIAKLDFQIDSRGTPKKETIGDLWKSPSAVNPEELRGKGQFTEQNILEEFRKEAGNVERPS